METQRDPTDIAKYFLQASKYLGYRENDPNSEIQTGFSIPQGTTRNGSRCSTSKAFLRPAKKRNNLHILTFSYVKKILFSKKRAIGLSFDRFGVEEIVLCRREVIVSAGSVNSPQLLMLSGIGPRDHLESLGIEVISDLPVGDNLQDHVYPGGIHFTVNSKNSIIQRRVVNLRNIAQYLTEGRGKSFFCNLTSFLFVKISEILSTSFNPRSYDIFRRRRGSRFCQNQVCKCFR